MSATRFPVSAWAIRNPVPVSVLFLGLIVAGLIAYFTLPIKLYPNVQYPLVAVTVTQSGAAAGELETQVTRPVEDAIAGLSGVNNIISTVNLGVSTTTIEFDMGIDADVKSDEVRARIDQARAVMPRDIDEPIVTKIEIDSSQPILTYAVAAEGMSDDELSWFVDDIVSRAVQSAKGVAQVTRVGGVAREINVLLDPNRLAARGLTAAEVNNALRAFQTDVPGGRISIGDREQTVRILGTVRTVEQLRELSVPTPGGGSVRLSDVADVADGSSEPRGFARLDGRPVVGFQVAKTKEASDVVAEDQIAAKVAELAKAYPNVTFTKIFSTVDETRTSFEATKTVLLEGMLLAALVVFIFLRDWRSTLITAVAMPMSLIPTFLAMQLLGFSLNMVTLLALTLVVGILVDDAIVEIENIEKRVAQGQRPYQAALEGADAIGLAVLATTMAIVVVFTPVSFMAGVVGQFFREFGLTVSVAVIFSLVVARLLTPLLAAYMLKPAHAPAPRKPFEGRYRRVLDWALDHRIAALAIGGALFIGSVMLVPMLPQGFVPASDPNYMYVSVQGPPGASVAAMEETVQRVTEVFADQPEVEGVFAQVGSTAVADPFAGGGGGGDLRTGTITILLDHHRKVSGNDIRARVRDEIAAIPDARIYLLGYQGTPSFQQVLTGDNPLALQRAAGALEAQMRTLSEVVDPRPSSPPIGPEIIIRPRLDEAARLGVSTEAIAQAARVATVGDIDANVAKLNEGERRIPIRVRLPKDARADLESIGALRVRTASGDWTTLSAVADISFQAGPARIDRLNRQRQITIQAELNEVELGVADKAVKALPIMKNLPEGVRPGAVGDTEAMMEMMTGFGIALFAGVSMIYAVLVLLFRSFFKPVVILSALPLAIGGAFVGLLALNLALSIPSLIGLLMLFGLAAKNSILLVEYAIERERDGLSQRESLLEACRERARPIVMTTMAMMAGMLPTALALERGSEFRQPMAVAVIGGLITSTMLSLVLVPVVYEFVDDFEQWLKPKLARWVTPRDAARAAAPEDRL